MLISIATPLLLVLTTAFKLGSLARAALYGDYLYAVSYDVPIRIVRATLPDDLAGSLLIAPIGGDAEAARPKSAEAMIARHFLFSLLCMRAAFILSMYLFCLPFFVGPFFMKLAFIAQNTSMGYSLNGAVHLFLLSMVFILPTLSLATLYSVRTEVDFSPIDEPSPVRKCWKKMLRFKHVVLKQSAIISWISFFPYLYYTAPALRYSAIWQGVGYNVTFLCFNLYSRTLLSTMIGDMKKAAYPEDSGNFAYQLRSVVSHL